MHLRAQALIKLGVGLLGRLFFVGVCALAAGRAGDAQSFTLSYTSDPGDPIGQGVSASYTELDGSGVLSMGGNGSVYFEFQHATNPAIDWFVGLAAADDALLVPGTYTNVHRYPFQPAGQPGLTWRGMGTYCGSLTGSFTVHSLTRDYFYRPRRISVAVEQHCNGLPPALHGQLDFDFGGMGPVEIEPDSLLVSSGYLLHGFDFEGALLEDYPILSSSGEMGDLTDPHYDFFRDLAVGPTGLVFGVSGTFTPSLRIWDPVSGSWSTASEVDWEASNGSDPGGLAVMESFVFVTDSQFEAEQTLLRYDTGNDSWFRFGRSEFYKEIAAGWDGHLYALRFSDSATVDKYDPMTLQIVGSVTLATQVDAIAAASDGRVYGLAGAPSSIYRFSPHAVLSKGASTKVGSSLSTWISPVTDASPSEPAPSVGESPRRRWHRSPSSLPPKGMYHPSFVAFVEPGYGSNRLFIDGFETGGASLWSAASP